MEENNKIIKDTIDEVLSKVKKYTDQSEQFSNANDRLFELLKQQEDIINSVTAIANECKNFCDSTKKKFDVDGYQVLSAKMKILSEFVDKVIDNHNDIVLKFQNSYQNFEESLDKLFVEINNSQTCLKNDLQALKEEYEKQTLEIDTVISNTNKTLSNIDHIEEKSNLIQETMLEEFESIHKLITENEKKQKKEKTLFLVVSGLIILFQITILLISIFN